MIIVYMSLRWSWWDDDDDHDDEVWWWWWWWRTRLWCWWYEDVVDDVDVDGDFNEDD